MPQYVEVQTPRSHSRHELDDDAAHEAIERQQQDASEQRLQLERMRYRAQLELRRMQSNMSSYVHDIDSTRSVARVYKPSVRERTRTALEGRWGVCLELVNFALSVLIFSMYIAELYDNNLNESTSRRYIEVFITSFFIFDLALHLFVAPSVRHYLLSPHGIVDLLTIVPSLIVFLVPAARSQLFFVLRVLRIFRALRVLRLKHFLRFKKSKFDYELAVFILSSVAVILCAAGMFHALEESSYLSQNETLRFHEALYFVLVTTATIGYGDISPRTAMGQAFVIVLILGIFTIVPHEVSKLNALAKQTHEYDKDYAAKAKSSGHVIVTGDELSTDAVLAFLHEFYHASRGNIHLDVVFLSDAPPTPDLARILAAKTYRWRACYLRGNITNSSDQRRVRLESATAVFLLAAKRLHCDPAVQDATTVLHALSVRNFADSTGQIVDIYTQLLSHRAEHELASRYLGAHPATASTLQNLILARAAMCPGASTLILNLLQSVDVAEYAKHVSWRKLWIQEYLDGMCHQLFPMVFTDRFASEKFEDVARHVYEHYGAILVAVYDKRVQRRAHRESPSGVYSTVGSSSTGVPLAPFQSYIYEGDIGFVIAKSASVVLHIVNTYGHWRDDTSAERAQASTTNVLPVRVSSDSLLRRPSPHNSFRASARALNSVLRDEQSSSGAIASWPESARGGFRERKWREHNDDLVIATDSADVPIGSAAARDTRMQIVHPHASAGNGTLHSIDEARDASSDQPVAHGMRVLDAVRMRDTAQVLAALQQEHYRADAQHMTDHYVVCAGALADALEVVHSLRSFYQYEQHARLAVPGTTTRPGASLLKQAQQLSVRTSRRCFVLLVPTLPDAHTVMRVFHERHNNCENVLESVYFVAGSSSRSGDLVRAGTPRARYVLVLPADAAARHGASPSEVAASDDVNSADFGVISSMLAVEISRQQHGPVRRGSPVSPRRRRFSSRTLSADVAVALKSADVAMPSYQREVDQGLPIESVKLRMLERFPDLDATVFRESNDVIDARLHDHLDTKQSSVGEHASSGACSDTSAAFAAENSTLGVLEHAVNARFCRPRDSEVCHDEFPCLTPSFASGNIFLASLLERIVCQSFYNPYITDLVVSLAAGSPVTASVASCGAGLTSSFRDARLGFDAASQRHRRLFRIRVDAVFVGGKFFDMFLELLRLDMLAVAILRSPNAAVLENLLPYVYTCPDPETVLHAHDRIFVIG